ncbi:DEAD/DEAH box helicase family protein [Dehalococcoidia bacterium]|nr:DEAD/DEAH box helicase family protein [Dehalococcoidia bacterium]
MTLKTEGFLSRSGLITSTWPSLERSVARLMSHQGFSGVRVVGQSHDGGADILAHRNSKRYLVQVKYRKSATVGLDAIDATTRAAQLYRASFPVIATNSRFSRKVRDAQVSLAGTGIDLQLWDGDYLQRMWEHIPDNIPGHHQLRAYPYQEEAIRKIVESISSRESHRSLVVLATGLGKTFVVAEALRRIRESGRRERKVLVLAHTNPLVYQLEKAFHPFLNKYETTTVWNGREDPDLQADITFACIKSVHPYYETHGYLPAEYDLVVVDECHHSGGKMYSDVLNGTDCGSPQGPYLIGLTATPFRSDGKDPKEMFGDPIVNIDLIKGLRDGYLSNVEYRIHLDNIDWDHVGQEMHISPRALNKSLFIQGWDDAVINVIRNSWHEVNKPRAMVFCENIDHALMIRDKINTLGFAHAAALYNGGQGTPKISHIDRNRILSDFHDGQIDILCSVNVLNEGIDVPDVNIVVFQRVTHSRIIFVQQLGRGLRLSENKDKVLVLDFVSDVRRIAAGIDIKDGLRPAGNMHLNLNHEVRFVTQIGEDAKAESFLRQWLGDVKAIESAGEDAAILLHPPTLIQDG